MSKKTLLEEAQVRRMFALAGNPALGESFISNRFSKFNEEEEDEAPVDDAAAEDPLAGEEDPLAADAEAAPAEEAPAEGGEIPQDKVEAIVDAVLAGIEEETGVPLERVPGEGEEAGAGEEVPAEDPMAAGAEEDPMAAGAEEEPVEEDPMAMERRVVNEVARRVARRLVRMSRKK
tara:strand:- start:3082 stop:3609 length:528 start_codon:yes stop_codon:yes gene_type:complete